MTNSFKKYSTIIFTLAILACSSKKESTFIVLKNPIATDRSFETITLDKNFLQIDSLENVGILNIETNTLEITQLVDNNYDNIPDVLLFQPEIAKNSEKRYEIVKISDYEKTKSIDNCYSRFVPERTDDYTWENNKVAFRIFGPTAQKMKEDGVAGGTLSSGVDAWLKRVNYPIINKWYKKELETDGSYHEDTGEGLDNFHVGVSRGVGGIAIKKDTSFFFSKNYTNWKTITTGPIRTSFSVDYADWHADGTKIEESRIISLDYGQNLSKFQISLKGSDTISAGLTLHEKDGIVSGNNKQGWLSYWQPHEDSELGTAILAKPASFIGYEKYDVSTPDLSNAYAHLKVTNNTVNYYAGFGWKKSGQFNTKQEWEQYLSSFSEKLNNPIQIELIREK